MISIISKLKSHGLITNVLGSIPSKIRPALAIWARKEPKDAFLAFVALSEAITNEPLTVFVDDLCSQLVMERTQNDQAKMNERYREFFKAAGCVAKFSSEIYGNEFSTSVFPLLIELGRHVPVSEFKRCLPKDKRRNFNELTLDEILHLLLELSLLERIAKECNLLLVGHFSQAIVVCHRKTSQNPISAIAIPRLNSKEEIDDYKRKIAIP